MNDDMKLKMDYRETFAEIHAPEALARKVSNMTKFDAKTKISFTKRFAVAAAAFAILFAGSNGVAYAATGSTWVESVVVYFNGFGYDAEVGGEAGEDAVTYTETKEQDFKGTEITIDEETPFIMEEYNVTTEE